MYFSLLSTFLRHIFWYLNVVYSICLLPTIKWLTAIIWTVTVSLDHLKDNYCSKKITHTALEAFFTLHFFFCFGKKYEHEKDWKLNQMAVVRYWSVTAKSYSNLYMQFFAFVTVFFNDISFSHKNFIIFIFFPNSWKQW